MGGKTIGVRRLAIVTNLPAPYRCALFSSLHRRLAGQFKVFFSAPRQTKPDWFTGLESAGFEWEETTVRLGSNSIGPSHLDSVLQRFRPTEIVAGGAGWDAWLSWISAKKLRGRFFLWFGGKPFGPGKEPRFNAWNRKLISRLSEGILAYSESTLTDLVQMGIPRVKIRVVGNVTFDVENYSREISALRASQTPTQERIILAISQLIPRKNLAFLIEQFVSIERNFPEVVLVIAGDGPERAALESLAWHRIPHRVRFLGHVSPADIQTLLARADLLVHPSFEDQGPQAVHEAMAAGCPVLVADTCGIAENFLGGGGQILPPSSGSAWREALSFFLRNPRAAEAAGAAGMRSVAQWGGERVSSEIIDAIYGGRGKNE